MTEESSDTAFMACEAIAREQGAATGKGEYADGYRAAADLIAERISARGGDRAPTGLERDLRDAEMEARAFARFIEVVRSRMETSIHREGTAELRGLLRELHGEPEQRDVPHARRSESGTLPRVVLRKGLQ